MFGCSTPAILHSARRGRDGAYIQVGGTVDPSGRRLPMKDLLLRFALSESLPSRASLLVDVSSGSYGVALAKHARQAGCSARIYVPLPEGRAVIPAIHAEGATPVLVDGSVDLARDAALSFTNRTPGAFFLDQHGRFELHSRAYSDHADFIARQAEAVDILMTFAGTGGLIKAFANSLRKAYPNMRIIRLLTPSTEWTARSTTFLLPDDCERLEIGDIDARVACPSNASDSPLLKIALAAASSWNHGLSGKPRILVLGTD